MSNGNPNFDTSTPSTPLVHSGQGYILVPWEPLMSGGAGYDSVRRDILPSAAADEFALEERPQGQGQTAQLKIQQVQTLEEVSQLISAQSDLKVGYDVFSATAIGRFLREKRMNKFSLYFLVLSYMERALVRLKGFKLSHSAEMLASDPAAFRNRYGDYFVEGYIAGGYLIGLAELRVQSEQILNEVQAKVRGKYDSVVTVDGGVETAWKNLEKIAGTDFSLQVIHAGIGEGIRAYAIAGASGGTGRDAGTGSSSGITVHGVPAGLRNSGSGGGGTGRAEAIRADIPKSLIQEVDDGDDDGDDGPSVEPLDPGIPVVTRPADGTAGPRNDSGNSGFQPIVNQLPDPPADYLPPLNMNLDGMLKAATALQAQSDKYRVRLLAQLRPYSTLDGGPKSTSSQDVFIADFNKKRKLLSDYYFKASFIHDSVRFALESRAQFAAKEPDLLRVKKEMEALMDGPNGYTKLWEELKGPNSQSVTYERIGNGPDESKIPKWAVIKSPFHPFAEELDPERFVKILEAAVDRAIATPIPERRDALKGYLKFVQEKAATNYAHAILALETLSLAFPMLDEQPAKRTKEIQRIATLVNKSKVAWTTDSNQIHDEFNKLDGKSGLDQKQLAFLAPLNTMVFGADEDTLGFTAFWKKLHDEINTLAQKSAGWTDDQKLADLIDYSNDWERLAEDFKTSSRNFAAIARRKLI